MANLISNISNVGFKTSEGGEIFNDYKGNIASSENSHAEGYSTKASGEASHAEGNSTTASGDGSHAEGNSTTAGQMGFKVTACEKLTDTTGTYTLTSVTGLYKNQCYSVHLSSSQEDCGKITAIDTRNKKITVNGYPDIALSSSSSSNVNYLTIVNRPELGDIIVSGYSSHAEGFRTKALGDYSHVQGKYNIEDTNNTYADIIGNGSSDTERSNAATVDWDGNAWYAGDVYVGSTSGTNRDEGSKKLATEEYVDSQLAVDYIVEQGTSGIWTYRKWASGVAECWGEYGSRVMPNIAWGDAHYYGKLPNFPFPASLFTMTPTVFVSVSDENGSFFIACKNSTPQSIGEMFAVTIGSSEEFVPIRLNFEAKGRWK